jgi:serine/threonine protein kinase
MTESVVLANGRFTVQRRIGAGGMGVVYEAWDREREQVVALKKLLGTDATAIVRLKNEFRALADVVHPNLVRLYELVGEGDDWFFTMELVDGVDFLSYVRRRAPSPADDATTEKSTMVDSARGHDVLARAADRREEQEESDEPVERVPVDYNLVRRTMRQIAEGVAVLHGAGKLHRDLKPSNVLVTPAERVVILDFGLATDVSAMQRKMTFGGTPAYMAPEQIADQPATSASDCYSIGVMLYEALTSSLPFSGNFYSMLMQKRTTDPRPPRELVDGVPDDLSRVCVELLRRNPQDRLSAHDMIERLSSHKERMPPIINRSRETPFVGRETELAQLRDAFQATEKNVPVMVMLRGSSGIGKTALVRHFLQDVQQREPSTVILTGRCYEQESVPYKAVDSLIDDLARYLGRVKPLEAKALMPRDVAALGRLFPVLQELDPVARAKNRKPVDILDSLELRRRAFLALRELFSRLADEHRVILFLDDVQWGDRDSAALLAEVLRPPEAPPMLIIASYRSEEAATSPLLAELQRYRDTEAALGELREIALEQLTGDEARDLARSLLHEPSGEAERVEAIAREAGGSPFFIVELARFSEATGLGMHDLDDVIRSRISLLPDVARELLEIVAVAGRPIASAAANAAANLHADDAAMQARLRADHLLRTRVRSGREELDTYHDRIREAILASLDAERCRLHHRTLAETLEAQGRRDPEMLAVHYRGAADNAKAAAYAYEAGELAAAALAFENAAHLFQMALELEERPRAELLIRLADALANAGRGADAAPHYMRAAEQSEPMLALELRRRASEALLRTGHVDAGLRIIREVLASIGRKLPETTRRAVVGILAGRALLKLRGLEFKETRAEDVPRELLTAIDVCWAVTIGLSRIDNIRAAYFQPLHLRLALKAGEPYRIARALATEAAFSATRGEKAKTRTEKLVTRTERIARRTGEPHAIGMSMLGRALESFYLGMFRDAFQKAEEAETIFRERCTGVAWEINTTVNYALCSLAYLGEIPQLAQRIPSRLREAEEHGDLYAGIDPVCRPGIMWLAADDPEGGRRAVRQVMDRWSLEGFHFQHYLEMFAENQIDLYLGRWASAWRRADERWPLMRASMLLRMPFVKIESLHLKGRSALAAAIGSRDAALLESVDRDAKEITEEKEAWAQPFALALRAGVARLRSNDELAADLLDRAARGFERAGVMLYARAASYRRGQLLGGDEGREIREASESWMRGQGVRNVPRLVDVLVPGFV